MIGLHLFLFIIVYKQDIDLNIPLDHRLEICKKNIFKRTFFKRNNALEYVS